MHEAIVADLRIAEELHSQIPGSTLKFIPNVGHVSNLEAPDAFNSAVRGFLHSLP